MGWADEDLNIDAVASCSITISSQTQYSLSALKCEQVNFYLLMLKPGASRSLEWSYKYFLESSAIL